MQTSDIQNAKPAVVVVENDAALIGALKFALELEGFGVTTFRSGVEILAEKHLPETGCLVIDFNLAGTNGLDVVDALRKRSVNLPVVLITSHPSAGLRMRAQAAGARIVEKPLLGDMLLDAIQKTVKARPLTAP
jgi:two-component system, LuxR family, response regulator FixJ